MPSSEVRAVYKDRFVATTFGQLGEDAVIDNHLGWLGLRKHAAGKYLDIGAQHPTRGSNTYRFYRRGSSGVVVDIGDRKRNLWKRFRSRDLFIDSAVVPDDFPDAEVPFLLSNDYGSATDHVGGYGMLKERTGAVSNFVRALRAHDLAALVREVDGWFEAPWRIVSLDIEGLDWQVLKDLKPDQLRADVVAVESFVSRNLSPWDKVRWHVSDSELVQAMTKAGYSLQSICGPTLVFVFIASCSRLEDLEGIPRRLISASADSPEAKHNPSPSQTCHEWLPRWPGGAKNRMRV